ncbi:hypothetical protein CKO23_23005 [Thiocystis violacea]|nr:hypothetical protein [Thiocystis violacea]
MQLTLVSASYNAVQTLAETLGSVEIQQGIALEYLLIDVGSSDGTVELIRAESGRPRTPVSR